MNRRTFIKQAGLFIPATFGIFVPKLIAQPRGFNPTDLANVANRSAAAAGITYLVEEDFEGTGEPSGWNDVGVIVNYDYAVSPLQGAQSLKITSASGLILTLAPAFTSSTDLWAYFMVRLDTLGGGESQIFGFSDGAAIQVQDSTGKIRVNTSSDGTYTTDGMSSGVDYQVWLHWDSDGTSSVGFSTDGTRPTSGNKFSSNAATAAGPVTTAFLSADSGWAVVFDKFRVSQSEIGSNPT